MNELEISAKQQSCPTEDELSGWFDGDGADHIGPHLEICPQCRAVIDFYQRVDGVMRRRLQPRAELFERVMAVCQHQEVGGGRDGVIPFWIPLLRAVAGIALIAGISGAIVVLRSDNSPQSDSGPIATTHGSVTANQQEDTPSNQDTADGSTKLTLADDSLERPNGIRVFNPGSMIVNPDQLQLTTAVRGQGLGRLLPKPFDGLDLAPSILPSSVHHVWVVDDVEKCQEYLAQNLPIGTALCAARNDRTICFQVVLSDQQLQGLVNRLQENGWALVTPNLPQPGEQDRLLLTGKEVLYVVDLVSR